MKILMKREEGEGGEGRGFEIKGGGCLFWLLKKMFRIVDR